jgi:very-short-patch-repair endonuclease
MGWNGRHALNGGELQVLQYFVDYYEPDLNLVIEWDEPHHKYRREKDKIRQERIEKKLNCIFIRILAS